MSLGQACQEWEFLISEWCPETCGFSIALPAPCAVPGRASPRRLQCGSPTQRELQLNVSFQLVLTRPLVLGSLICVLFFPLSLLFPWTPVTESHRQRGKPYCCLPRRAQQGSAAAPAFHLLPRASSSCQETIREEIHGPPVCPKAPPGPGE